MSCKGEFEDQIGARCYILIHMSVLGIKILYPPHKSVPLSVKSIFIGVWESLQSIRGQ